MTLLVHCVGTGTDVGKTWWGAATVGELLARGATVAARKPVQSHHPGDRPDALDAAVLAAATGEPVDTVCSPGRTFGVAMAPPMAAAALGLPCPTVAELAAVDRPPVDVLWVEGVGGPRSPVAADGDGVGLAAALAPDLVVLVADAHLGAVNAVALCQAALADHPVVVALNRYDDTDDLCRRNRTWLVDRLGADVVTSPAATADRLLPSRAPSFWLPSCFRGSVRLQ